MGGVAVHLPVVCGGERRQPDLVVSLVLRRQNQTVFPRVDHDQVLTFRVRLATYVPTVVHWEGKEKNLQDENRSSIKLRKNTKLVYEWSGYHFHARYFRVENIFANFARASKSRTLILAKNWSRELVKTIVMKIRKTKNLILHISPIWFLSLKIVWNKNRQNYQDQSRSWGFQCCSVKLCRAMMWLVKLNRSR